MRVAFRCDAGRATGLGHLVRCVGLAEELRSRHVDVLFFSELDGLGWAEHQLVSRGLPRRAPPETPAALARVAVELGLDAVVLDGYHLDPDTGRALRKVGVTVLAIVDASFGARQEADVYLDQNLGAELSPVAVPNGAVRLAGVPYALLRDVVRDRRPPHPPALGRGARHGSPSVLAVFGGSDPYGAASVVIPLLVATKESFALTAVASRHDVANELRRLKGEPGQHIRVIPLVDDLPAAVIKSELVLTASGTTTWEMLCLGATTAIVCVTDNQESGYRHLVESKLAAPLGRLEELASDASSRRRADGVLHALLTDPKRRAVLGARAWEHVDGHGRRRVADVLLERMEGTAVRRAPS